MLKHLHFKTMLLLCALIVGSASAWAGTNVSTVTTKFSKAGEVTTNFTQTGDFKEAAWNLAVTWKTSESWQNLDGTKGAQVGSGSKPATGIVLTGSNISGTITSVIVNTSGANSINATVAVSVGSTEFKCGGNTTASLTNTAANYEFVGTGTGNIVMTWANSSSKAIYIKSVTVTYDDGPAKENVTLSFPKAEYTADINDGFTAPTLTNASGVTVTYSSSDEDVATVNASTGEVELKGVGSSTITASFAGNESYYSASAQYTLTVSDRNANDGSQEKPFTVAEAIAFIKAKSYGEGNYYVKGKISQIKSTSVIDGGYLTYYISDDGTTTNQLQVYKGKNLNNAAFTSVGEISVLDQVIVVGPLLYYDDKTPEINTGNHIHFLSPDERGAASLEYENDSFDLTFEKVEGFVAPTLTNPNHLAVTYSSSDETIAVVDENTGEVVLDKKEGTVTITATFAGNESYQPGSASYTIKITDVNKKGAKGNPYTIAEVINGTATGSDIYVVGYIVGEFVGSTQAPRTSGFTTDANIAVADEFTTTPKAETSIPVAIPSDGLKSQWGNKTNNGNRIGCKVLFKGNADTYFSVNAIKYTSEVIGISAIVTVSDAEYATWVAPFGVEVPSGVEAYYVTEATTSALLTDVLAIAEDQAVVLKNAGTYEFPACDDETITALELPANLLKASDGTVKGSANTYVLAKDETKGVGFYVLSSEVTIPAGKAYLQTAAGAPEFLSFVFDSQTTGINKVNGSETMVNGYYNLAGQRVAKPTKGLYIVNGKKVVIK